MYTMAGRISPVPTAGDRQSLWWQTSVCAPAWCRACEQRNTGEEGSGRMLHGQMLPQSGKAD